MFELDLGALFLAGLLGGGHCLGMCGGVVTAFSLQLPPGPRWRYHLGFNLGRLLGYALIGAIVGGLGSLTTLLSLQAVKTVLFALAQALLILMGLYLAGWSGWLRRVEKLGVPVWQRIQPVLRRLLPIRNWPQSVAVGMLWGWLPCGLVYTASLSALASASPVKGAAILFLFGIGTLPNLLLIGAASGSLLAWMRAQWVRKTSGVLLIAIGVFRLCQMAL
ncbi:sulfite exporter TauE/SafE family protein [Andreprevotia chitinilytica]|uniref:sulfite exporter TauE/SafE family protein n=1 Tax=Andreprevotia chitinilytica TaxID=396808 RepID=UPI00054DC568|nr:sulfite exporter TauE/SafE family protein [Andreprevotia chitinilytica]